MKRFTETAKWIDPWFHRLSPGNKLLWHYLCDNCDAAGVIDLDLDIAAFHIGVEKDKLDVSKFGDRIERLECGKYWLTKFVKFQYGRLSEQCKAHGPALNLLKQHGLDDRLSIPFPKGMERDKVQDKEKEKVQDKENTARENLPTLEAFCDFYFAKLPDLGAPVALGPWLMEKHGYLASEVWPARPPKDWQQMLGKLEADYRSRHAEKVAKPRTEPWRQQATPPRPSLKPSKVLPLSEQYAIERKALEAQFEAEQAAKAAKEAKEAKQDA